MNKKTNISRFKQNNTYSGHICFDIFSPSKFIFEAKSTHKSYSETIAKLFAVPSIVSHTHTEGVCMEFLFSFVFFHGHSNQNRVYFTALPECSSDAPFEI